jgi:glutathione synthase/RimK-type ligase-like ATP-grasp enzyme
LLLIVTQRGDLTADWLIVELERRGAPFVRFNTEDYPMRASLTWRPDGAALGIGGGTFALDEFSSVWYRRPAPPRMPEDLAPGQAVWAARESRQALLGAWRTLDALWVNHPDHNCAAESKPHQLMLAGRLGFDVPATVVTNEPEQLKAFADAHPEGVVCKPLWNGRVPDSDGRERLFFTSPVNGEALGAAEELGPEPYLFQELLPKRFDVRVTVIGREVFAARIDSQQTAETRVDWRRGRPGELRHEPAELPAEVARRCLDLCEHYGLRFAAIDLAERSDGGYTFFEVNPNGQWAWVEQRTGLPLRSRLADLLLAATRT